MGEKDAYFKEYAGDNRRFADLFNYYVYHGRQVIKPENLRPANIEQIICCPKDESDDNSLKEKTSSTKLLHQNRSIFSRFRDLFKLAVFKHDEHMGYLFLGLEEQSSMCQFMPVRVMLYDAMTYSAQSDQKRNQLPPDIPQKSANRLIPVVTLVVYFGQKQWTAPKSLYDMMPNLPEELKAVIPNFWINMIELLKLNEKDYEQMKTNWDAIFEAFRVYVDSGVEKYYDYWRQSPRMTEVGNEEIRMLETMTECQSPVSPTSPEDAMNANKMVEEYFSQRDARVIEDAKPKIIEDAKPKIIEDAKPKIIEEGAMNIAKRMLNLGISLKDIQAATQLSAEQLKSIMES